MASLNTRSTQQQLVLVFALASYASWSDDLQRLNVVAVPAMSQQNVCFVWEVANHITSGMQLTSNEEVLMQGRVARMWKTGW